MKKRKQHYVWQYYLKPWSSKGQIYCLKLNDCKIFETNLTGIANQRDFYRLQELNFQDIIFLKKLIEKFPPFLQKIAVGWVDLFTFIYKFRDFANKNSINNPEIEAYIDEMINNFEEDMHGHIESDSIQYINSLLERNTNFYKTDKGNSDFNYFLSVQYMRTKKLKANMLSLVNKDNTGFFNIEKVWNVLSHIFATNIDYGVYLEIGMFII